MACTRNTVRIYTQYMKSHILIKFGVKALLSVSALRKSTSLTQKPLGISIALGVVF